MLNPSWRNPSFDKLLILPSRFAPASIASNGLLKFCPPAMYCAKLIAVPIAVPNPPALPPRGDIGLGVLS